MDVTNRFVLDFAIRHGGRLLDYGCGRGEVVIAARAAGLDAYGTDIYYAGAETRAPDTPFIRPMNDGQIPFEDGSFNLVTNNQVMELPRFPAKPTIVPSSSATAICDSRKSCFMLGSSSSDGIAVVSTTSRNSSGFDRS